MFGSNVLDIGIGLILTYLFLSLTVTAANELVASGFRSRARDLERGIRNLLDGTSALPERWWQVLFRLPGVLVAKWKKIDPPRKPTPGVWSEAFFRHQLINALSKDGQKPSYVPPQTFATVLLHLVQSEATVTNAAEIEGAPAAATPLSGLPDFDDIRKAIEKISDPTIKAALLPLVEEARHDLTSGISAMKKVSDRIEKWYDQTMERVSGWYKRRTQWFLFGIALLITVVLNVDSVKICKRLSKDATLRKSLVAMAKQTASPPASAKSDNGKTTPAKTEPAKPDLVDNFKQVEQAVGKLDGLGIPLGWSDPFASFDKLIHTRRGNVIIATKLLGLLLTAFAASLGAPFWFDVLNKFMSVRSAGKAPEEKPKGPK
jgi:hypothetical protein